MSETSARSFEPFGNIQTEEQYYTALEAEEEAYEPAGFVIDQLHHVHETTVTGPSGSGKDTTQAQAIEMAAAEDIEIWKIVSNADRKRRRNDGVLEVNGREYWFVTPKVMHQDVADRTLVQWVVNKELKNAYGSSYLAYPKSGFAVMDVAASALPKLREHRDYYGSLKSAGLFVPGDEYMPRFRSRYPGGVIPADTLLKRLNEGHTAIPLMLDDPEMHLIVNDERERAAKELMQFVLRREVVDPTDQAYARKCGMDMLRIIRTELDIIPPQSLHIPRK